jgi:hypothetical protein
MKRKLLNLLTALSLLLCVAIVVLWLRSYWVLDNLGRVGQTKVIAVRSAVGSLDLGVTGADPENEQPGPRPYYFYNAGRFGRSSGVISAGTLFKFESRISKSGLGWIVVPHWIPALVLAVPPAVVLWKRRASWWASSHFRFRVGPLVVIWLRRKVIPLSHCQSCGYDLRATPGRCPECGTSASVTPSP